MGLRYWLKSIFKAKEQKDTFIDSVPIFKSETPTKIVETRIKPIKIPTIVDVGERLGLISKEILEMKNDLVTKTWFMGEYEDAGSEVIDKLENIEEKLNLLTQNISQLTHDLSNFTKKINKSEITVPIDHINILSIPDQILHFLEKKGKLRYKDLRSLLKTSDPTLSKYLQNLHKFNKIKRIKAGKAVYYELISI